MLKRDFPKYTSHKSAAAWGCRQCSGPLDPTLTKYSGYPPKRGQYVLFCPKCGFGHWYDLSSSCGRRNTCENPKIL